MQLFGLFRQPNINQGLVAYAALPDGILLDVRSPHEYMEGHIPGSQNLPLRDLDDADYLFEKKDAPIFTYCYSGSRSHSAVRRLQELGFSNVKNIGGIIAYQGPLTTV